MVIEQSITTGGTVEEKAIPGDNQEVFADGGKAIGRADVPVLVTEQEIEAE